MCIVYKILVSCLEAKAKLEKNIEEINIYNEQLNSIEIDRVKLKSELALQIQMKVKLKLYRFLLLISYNYCFCFVLCFKTLYNLKVIVETWALTCALLDLQKKNTFLII